MLALHCLRGKWHIWIWIKFNTGHVLGSCICGCSLFYRRELWSPTKGSFFSESTYVWVYEKRIRTFWKKLPLSVSMYLYLRSFKLHTCVLWYNSLRESHTMRRNLPKIFSVLKFWINLLNFSLKNNWQTVKK